MKLGEGLTIVQWITEERGKRNSRFYTAAKRYLLAYCCRGRDRIMDKHPRESCIVSSAAHETICQSDKKT